MADGVAMPARKSSLNFVATSRFITQLAAYISVAAPPSDTGINLGVLEPSRAFVPSGGGGGLRVVWLGLVKPSSRNH